MTPSRKEAKPASAKTGSSASASGKDVNKSQNALLESLVHNMLEGALVLDGHDRILFANEAAAILWNRASVESLCGQTFSSLLPDSRRSAWLEGLSKVNMKQGVYQARYEIEFGRGLSRWIEVTGTRMEWESREGILLTLRDVSERKRIEQMLTETNAQLAQALKAVRQKEQELVQHERLRALGQMASGVAHDFNNALQPILLSAGMVLEDPSKQTPARMKKYLQEILVAARDAAATVKRLVRFYRPPVTDGLGSVNLSELFNEVIALTRPKWRDEALSNGCTIRIRTDVDNSLTVSGQADELREVFINLVFNAITAIHGTGEISLKARRQEYGGITITVEDSGMGMPEDIRAQCFEPFVTTKQDQGAGLGLAIVYGIIQRQGGTISVDSKPRHGTMFSIYLPEGADRVAEPKVTQSAGVMPTGRILVVEDELEVCNLLAGTLRHEGFTVTTAIDGRQGWELFQQKRFDLVLTDQALPEMPGDRLAARIKEMDPQTPVIMLTGYGGMMRARGHVPVHIDQLLDKPVSTEKLRQAIKTLLERGADAKESST